MDAPGRFATLVPPDSIHLPPSVPDKQVRDGTHYDRAGVQRVCANYYGKMALIDENIGRLIEAVKRRGNWENTLVIFSSDHGEMMGAHGCFSKGRFYEESGRVPLMMRWPGHIQGGRTSRALCQMFDIYPTIVEAIGGKPSTHHFARSLLPVAQGKSESLREAAFSEISSRAAFNFMVRTPEYVWWVHRGREALYDMRRDPYQLENLIASGSHRGVLDEMKMRHLEYFKTTQINLSDSYRPLMDRLTEEGGGKQGLAERLYQQYRRKQKLQ